MTNISEKFDQLAQLKAEAKSAQAAADDTKRRLKEYEAQLWEEAKDKNTLGISTELGRYNLKSTPYGTITDFEAFETWVKENDLADEFLKVSEQSARINELVRTCLENHQDLPAGVGYYERRYISFTSNKDD